MGLHNEYYGYGSGVFLNCYNAYINSNNFYYPDYAVSFDYNDTLKLKSISYFPSKVLELINLFDGINYSYNNILNNNDALLLIKENYLDMKVKIDPIIFDIFSSFVYYNEKLIA